MQQLPDASAQHVLLHTLQPCFGQWMHHRQHFTIGSTLLLLLFFISA
jgi:hypothetical protein